jgi:phage baseplate assembly protein W
MYGISFYDNDFFVKKTDNELILEEITRVLQTIPGERINNSEFGSSLKMYLYEFGSKVKADLGAIIKKDLERWLPYITVNESNVFLNTDSTAYISVSVSYNNQVIDYDTSINF